MKQKVRIADFHNEIKSTIKQFSSRTYQAVNFAMVQAYWQTGKRIVEKELKGSARAGYGEYLIDNQSAREFYLNEAANEHRSTSQLERQIQTNYFQRVLSSRTEKQQIKNDDILMKKLVRYEKQN